MVSGRERLVDLQTRGRRLLILCPKRFLRKMLEMSSDVFLRYIAHEGNGQRARSLAYDVFVLKDTSTMEVKTAHLNNLMPKKKSLDGRTTRAPRCTHLSRMKVFFHVIKVVPLVEVVALLFNAHVSCTM